MITLSDTLRARDNRGFMLPSSTISINHLHYVDNASVISSTQAGCQHILDVVPQCLEWAQLKEKVQK